MMKKYTFLYLFLVAAIGGFVSHGFVSIESAETHLSADCNDNEGDPDGGGGNNSDSMPSGFTA